MAAQLFEKMQFSLVYQKYMIPVSNAVINMIVSYVKEKTNEQPLDLALDVGCGTGRYTLPLAPHFKKVLGIDISDSQINVAKQNNTASNVSYMVAAAEKLPIKDDSVDLVNAGLAVHWFILDDFAGEVARVLKKNGCLALHGFHPSWEIKYKDLSQDLSKTISEVWDTLCQYAEETSNHVLTQYQNIYEAVTLKDKEWITDIPVTITMSISEILGFFQSVYMFQILLEKDVKEAEELIIETERRLRDILGEEADSVRLDVHMKHYCVLACKH
ncbi:hypothetical protein GDO81_017255 [Engystomops pustulosus]|uniref:Methyltransferase type 11 domain-containing protein n=1 Tax=Engystomops pustulosus TaxID=76066 RepID=A0AAV7AKC5_ENGPU|nr:hypothetical protein GDO81_017255 [Engystomops pustulosus]KAG8559149.1 hypothetical protein GDO81_017255 [Engystomops pustulosus]